MDINSRSFAWYVVQWSAQRRYLCLSGRSHCCSCTRKPSFIKTKNQTTPFDISDSHMPTLELSEEAHVLASVSCKHAPRTGFLPPGDIHPEYARRLVSRRMQLTLHSVLHSPRLSISNLHCCTFFNQWYASVSLVGLVIDDLTGAAIPGGVLFGWASDKFDLRLCMLASSFGASLSVFLLWGAFGTNESCLIAFAVSRLNRCPKQHTYAFTQALYGFFAGGQVMPYGLIHSTYASSSADGPPCGRDSGT